MTVPFSIRRATSGDIPALADLIVRSTRELQSAYYTSKQLDGALGSAFGVDTALIADGTYFVVEIETVIAGCGGWSKRKALFGGDTLQNKDDALLDPAVDPARIRAFFVDPAHVRRGIASLLLRTCEVEAISHGFSNLELGATLAGIPLYLKHGFIRDQEISVPLPNGEILPLVRMTKRIPVEGDTSVAGSGIFPIT